MRVKRGELIVGHIPQVNARGRATCDRRNLCDRNGFGISYHFVGMSMMVPHGPGLRQNFFVHTVHRAPNLFPRFLVYAEFNIRHL